METGEAILLGLAVLLAVSVGLQYRWSRLHAPLDRPWNGHGINVQSMREQVEQVRNDFVKWEARTQDAGRRRGMLARARRAIRRLSYFRRKDERFPIPGESEARSTGGR